MINPTIDDIGRRVIYNVGPDLQETGVITSFNETLVFVRYGDDLHAKGTLRRKLEWESE